MSETVTDPGNKSIIMLKSTKSDSFSHQQKLRILVLYDAVSAVSFY